MAEQSKNVKEQDINQLLKVRREKLAELQTNGKDPFQIVKFDVTHHSQEIKDAFEELEGKSVTIAGRMMSKRIMGKAFLLQCSGFTGKHSVLCGTGQYRSGILSGFQENGHWRHCRHHRRSLQNKDR